MKVLFKGWRCILLPKRYNNNDRLALKLVDEEGIPIATCTVNLPFQELPENCVFIKDWSENEGMTEILIASNVINPIPLGRHTTGYVTVGAYELTDDCINYINTFFNE